MKKIYYFKQLIMPMKRYSQNLLKLFCLLWLTALAGNVHAQLPPVFFWGQNDGGQSFDLAHDCATDDQGNSYVIGEFQGTITFGATTTTLTSQGSQDVYVVKRDIAGNVLWATGIGGTAFDGGSLFEDKLGIDFDAAGNVYVTGTYGSNTLDIGYGTANVITINQNGTAFDNVFVAQLNGLTGVPIWGVNHGTDERETHVGDIDVNAAGTELVIAGWFNADLWNYGAAPLSAR